MALFFNYPHETLSCEEKEDADALWEFGFFTDLELLRDVRIFKSHTLSF